MSLFWLKKEENLFEPIFKERDGYFSKRSFTGQTRITTNSLLENLSEMNERHF